MDEGAAAGDRGGEAIKSEGLTCCFTGHSLKHVVFHFVVHFGLAITDLCSGGLVGICFRFCLRHVQVCNVAAAPASTLHVLACDFGRWIFPRTLNARWSVNCLVDRALDGPIHKQGRMRAESGPNERAAITREVDHKRSDRNQRSEERSLPGGAAHSGRVFFS